MWQVDQPLSPYVRLLDSHHAGDEGERFHRFRFAVAQDFQNVRLHLAKPRALAIDDFSATVRVNASQPGFRFGVRIVAPAQIDPRTGQPLVTVIFGDRYSSTEKWQTLSVRGLTPALEAKLRELRAEINRPKIDLTGAFVDGCVLLAEVHAGEFVIDLADGSYGPVVSPDTVPGKPAHSEMARPQTAAAPRIRIDRNKVLLQGEPIFPRFLPDHGESVTFLQRLGANVLWVPDLHAAARMELLTQHDFVVMATPPHPEFDPADFGTPLQGLPPLEQTAPAPDIWYLGTAIREQQLPHLLAWAREVRSADRQLRRPLVADVTAAEGVASRLVDFVGISQSSVGSHRAFGEARNRAFLRQNESAQLTLPWEWVQTEHATDYARWRKTVGGRPAFIEPEQILMQVVACLSAGSRGIGFWKSRPLETDSPLDRETATAIELANVYLDILEPLLIRGRVDGHIPVELPDSTPAESRKSSWLDSILGTAGPAALKYTTPPAGPDAAIINSLGTSVILAGFWDALSQYVPQQMHASRASLTVAASETASAWQISPTAVKGFRRQPTAGGLRLDLQEFDQVAVILVSSDLEERRRIDARVQQHAARAGQLFVDLATLKLNRVTQTCREIDQVAGSDAASADLLAGASAAIDRARLAHLRGDFPATEKLARGALRQIRVVQSRYWFRAIQSLPSPTASPHTASFSTLYDHWVMMRRIEAGAPSGNLLTTGRFEDQPVRADAAWKPVVTQEELYQASADIVSEAGGRNSVMRMRAWNRASTVVSGSAQPALLVQCPEIEVQQGDVLEISARIRFGQGVQTAQTAPFLIFDSDLGPEFAVSPRLEPSWRRFTMYRQVSASGPFRLWLGLKSPAEVYLDDLSVVRRSGTGPPPSAPDGVRRAGTDEVFRDQSGSRVQGAGYAGPSLP
ncbi:MAG: hypothetical protein RIK87_13785 [Fuerstiella sp.]